MKDSAVLFAQFYQMIQLYVRNVTWPSWANLVKMNGKDREMDNSNVQAASLKKKQDN